MSASHNIDSSSRPERRLLAPRSGGIAAQLPHDPSTSRPREGRDRFGRDDGSFIERMTRGLSRNDR
jgi:hypothetical protein